MTLGQKIKKLRNEKGLTQKELADKVYVTFQTVSKWEKDENEPDVSTLRELAKLFGCSMDYLLSEEEEVSTSKPEVVTNEVINKTVIIHQKELHVCSKCNKDIPEDELVVQPLVKSVRHGRHHSTENIGTAYYHKSCLDEINRIQKEQERKIILAKTAKAKKWSFGWGIAGGVVALTIFLIIFLCNTQYVHPALGVLYSVLIGFGVFTMLYCIISGSYIGEVFLWCANLSIKFPGIIFSWDLEGFAWLIAMKIFFAVLGFLIGVFALLFAIAVSSVLGILSFPFVLIHNNNNGYADALTN